MDPALNLGASPDPASQNDGVLLCVPPQHSNLGWEGPQKGAELSHIPLDGNFSNTDSVRIVSYRAMENKNRGPTFGYFVTIRSEASMQNITVAEYTSTESPPPPSFKCNVLQESLSPCATIKRRGRG
jgi:hypothetical protein